MNKSSVRLLTAAAIALSFGAAGILVPWLLDLTTDVVAWRASMIGGGVIFALGVYVWSLWALPSRAEDASGGDAARRFPLRVAQVFGTGALVSAAATLASFSSPGGADPVLVAVVTGLLLLLPTQAVYLIARHALRPIAGRGPHQLRLTGKPQPTRLSVVILMQVPLLACGLAIVLVEQSGGARYERDIAAWHQDRYLRLLDRASDLLTPAEVEAMHAALQPPPTIIAEPTGPRWRAGPLPRRALPLVAVPYLLLLLIGILTWGLGRWMSRRLAQELDTTRTIIDAIQEGMPANHTDLALNRAVASRNMVDLVDAVGLALAGFERRRTALRRAAERRTASERAKARFLRHLSHELKSPLNSILGFSELLLAEIDGPITPEQRDQLAAIWRSGEALERYILALLDLARLEEAGQAATMLAPKPSTASALTRSVSEQVRPDPLAQRIIEVRSTGDAGCVIDLDQTARAVRLAAGLLADCLREGTVQTSIGPAPGGGVQVDLEVIDAARVTMHPNERVQALVELRASDGASELAACLHLLKGVMAAQHGQFAMEIDDRGRPRCRLKLPAVPPASG